MRYCSDIDAFAISVAVPFTSLGLIEQPFRCETLSTSCTLITIWHLGYTSSDTPSRIVTMLTCQSCDDEIFRYVTSSLRCLQFIL